MRAANKPALADAIWALMPEDVVGPGSGQYQFVLDGGSLLHRIPWQRGTTYNDICRQYTSYVTRKYGCAIVVFDGYQDTMSTKDSTHQRRTGGHVGPTVDFSSDMIMKSKKEAFLSNKDNKQRFIKLLSDRLEEVGCTTHHADGDADVLIVQTAVQSADRRKTILVGDDTDLLVLLCFLVKHGSHEIFFRPELKAGAKKNSRCWNIKQVQGVLRRSTCNNLLFVHAILGCDTTSRVFSIGKGLALKLIRSDAYFRAQAEIFLSENATEDEIVRAGEAALVCLYKGKSEDTLNKLRIQRFNQKVSTSTSYVQPESLPPTSSAAKYHSLRVYYQVQIWKGAKDLDPQAFGWKAVKDKLLPVQCDMEVATKTLLEVVRCNCKKGCENMRCSCRKAGLDCSTGCGECRGICANMSAPTPDDSDSDDV